MIRIRLLRDVQLPPRREVSARAPRFGLGGHPVAITEIPGAQFFAGEYRNVPPEVLAHLVEGEDYRVAAPDDLPLILDP